MQSSKNSLIESIIKTLVGYGNGVLGQLIIFPWVDISVPLSSNFLIAFYFSVVSLICNFILRRIFNYFTG